MRSARQSTRCSVRRNTDNNDEALRLLQHILEEAIGTGADTVEFEYVDGGLEVCYRGRGTGIGVLLADRVLERQLIKLIIERAKLENKSRGAMVWTLMGKQYNIVVEEYERFGESAFRLILGKPKQ